MTAITESNVVVGANVVVVEEYDDNDGIVVLVSEVSFEAVVTVPLTAVASGRMRVRRAGSSRPRNSVVRIIARPHMISRQSSTLTSGELVHRRLVGRHADSSRRPSMASVAQSSPNSVRVLGISF